ncbi:hypothetical protein MOV98_15555 [Acinetobacter variabilis]|nr:hypothetical protein MOV98_15555 [Acinetobacter variabilis]
MKTDAAVKTAEVKEATVAKAEEVKAAPAEAAVKAEKKGGSLGLKNLLKIF